MSKTMGVCVGERPLFKFRARRQGIEVFASIIHLGRLNWFYTLKLLFEKVEGCFLHAANFEACFELYNEVQGVPRLRFLSILVASNLSLAFLFLYPGLPSLIL